MPPVRSISLLLVVCGVAVQTSCDTISTVTGQVDSKKRGQVRGMFYHLPQALIRIKGEYAKAGEHDGDFIITVFSSYVADPRTRYYLEPGTNVFYDDDFKIHTNAKGLLETVNLTAEDKTAAILGDIASTVGGALQFGAGVSPARIMAERPRRLPFDYTFSLDEKETINGFLSMKGFDLKIPEVQPSGASADDFLFPSERNPGGKSSPGASPREKASGIVFRPVTPYAVIITDLPFAKQLRQESPFIRHRSSVLIPDNNKKLLIVLGRTPFIKRTDNLVFTDGVLTKVEGTRPSAVVGFLQIPKTILTAIVPLPLEIRQTQVSNIEAQQKRDLLLAPPPTPTPATTSTTDSETRAVPTVTPVPSPTATPEIIP